MFVGGSGGGVFARGAGWVESAEGGAGGMRLPRKHRGEQAHDGDLLPSRWNRDGYEASGLLATPEDRIAAAGQTGEGHNVGGGFGDRCDNECTGSAQIISSANNY